MFYVSLLFLLVSNHAGLNEKSSTFVRHLVDLYYRYKQIDGCTMGRPISVIFSDIYMTKTEEEVVKPTNPSFYKRFIDDIISKKKRSTGLTV